MSDLHRSPSNRVTQAGDASPHISNHTEFLKPKPQYFPLGKKFGSQPFDKPDMLANVQKGISEASKEHSSQAIVTKNKENDRNLVNRGRPALFTSKTEARQIVTPGLYAHQSKDRKSPVHTPLKSSTNTVSKPLLDPKRPGINSNNLSKLEGQDSALRSHAHHVGLNYVGAREELVSKRALQSKSFISANARKHTEPILTAHFDSSEGKILNSARGGRSGNDSIQAELKSECLLSTKDKLSKQQSQGKTVKAFADSASSRDQMINLYEAQQFRSNMDSSHSVKVVRSLSHRSDAENKTSPRAMPSETGGKTAPRPHQQTTGSGSVSITPHKEVHGSNFGGSISQQALGNVSAFNTEDNSALLKDDAKLRAFESSKKPQNSSRGYLLDSLKKGPANLDSGLKRTRSQLKMDDLREIFEDDPKFIESTKKASDLNEFSFSEEKKKTRLVERFEVGSANPRKLDFTGEDVSGVISANMIAGLKTSPLNMHNSEVRKGIGMLNLERLKNQKRPEGSIDFNSIKNNLRSRKLGSGSPRGLHQPKTNKDSLFFGNLTLVKERVESEINHRQEDSGSGLRKLKGNVKLVGGGKSDKQLFNKTADGKFIQTELGLIEEEIQSIRNGRPQLANEISYFPNRHNSSGLVKHGWFNQNLKPVSGVMDSDASSYASPPTNNVKQFSQFQNMSGADLANREDRIPSIKCNPLSALLDDSSSMITLLQQLSSIIPSTPNNTRLLFEITDKVELVCLQEIKQLEIVRLNLLSGQMLIREQNCYR
jgi:hypothetical protein